MVRLTEVPPEQLAYDANLFQCALWAEFKRARQGPVQAFHIHFDGRRYPLVVVQRPVAAEASVGHAPHGPDVPVPADAQGRFLERLSEELRVRVPSSCGFLRWDLPWQDPYTASGEWSLPPEPRIREMRMNFGCQRWALRKAPTDLQPPDTVVLDLTRTSDELLAGMHRKHRYCVRTAFRRGVTVATAGPEALPEWHRLYTETSARQGIAAEELGYFRDLFATACRRDPDLRLYVAHHGGGMVAGSVVAHVGESAYYLFSASSLRGRAAFASFAVVWRAVEDARRRGLRFFDLMGIPPDDRPDHPMHGLYRFKTRFGGVIHRRRGCWDYPLDDSSYPVLAAAGTVGDAFHRG